jgi:hypothetical protein
MSAAKALNLITGNTPFANLWFVRPAMDALILNSLREAASPGYLQRQRKRRQVEYGQQAIEQTLMN